MAWSNLLPRINRFVTASSLGNLPTVGVAFGQRGIALDTGIGYVFNGTAWVLSLDDSGWIAATLLNSWTNFSPPAYPAACYRRLNGMVYLDGVVSRSVNPGSGSVIFVLPAGYRPTSGIRLFACMGGDNTAGRIDVDGSGNVTYQTGVTGFMSLPTIRFPADA